MAKKKENATIRTIRLEPSVEKALQLHMKSNNLTNMSRAINDAIKYALLPEHRDERDEESIKLNHKIFYSLNEHRKKTGRDLAAMQEIMLQFILSYYKQNPHSSQDDEHAQQRLDDLMELVISNMGKAKGMDD